MSPRTLATTIALWASSAFAQTPAKPAAPAPSAAPPPAPATAIAAFLEPVTLAERLASVALILVLCYGAYRVLLGGVRRAMHRAEERARTLPGAARRRQLRAVTVMSLASSILQWFISLLAVIWALGAVGVNLLPLLTGVGFLGAAVAFGAQSLVRDLVTGFFILLEGQYAVGDWVELNGKFGQVQTVGLRTTVLRDTRSQVHHIPNGTIATCTVLERRYVSQLLLVPLAVPEDAARACQILGQMAEDLRRDIPDHLLRVGTATCTTSASGFSLVSLPFSTFPLQDWLTTTELPNRARAVLTKHEIAIPEGLAPQCIPDLAATPLPAPPAEDPAEPAGPGADTPATSSGGARSDA